MEAGGPREKNRQVDQDTEERIPVVADLKRIDSGATFAFPAGDGRRGLHKSPRQSFQPKKSYQNDRHDNTQERAQPTTKCTTPLAGIFHYTIINNGGKNACQELP
jgi:hypothetical protein